MKTRILKSALVVVTLFATQGLFAQSKYGQDSTECFNNLSVYIEFYKQKNYKDAYPAWSYCYENCPASTKNLYIHGPNIVEYQIKANKANPAEAKKYTDILLGTETTPGVYDNRLKYFPDPKKTGYVYSSKGLDMLKYRSDDPQAAYDVFKKAYEAEGKEMSAAGLNGYFVAVIKLFQEKTLQIEDVFEQYDVVIEAVDFNVANLKTTVAELSAKKEEATITDKEEKELARAERELKAYGNLQSNIETQIGPIATCDRLVKIYTEGFEAHQADATWMKRAIRMMAKDRKGDDGEKVNCTDDPMFFKLAETLYALEPSAASATGMGKMFYQRKDFAKAIEYFKEAAEQEEDVNKKAENYLSAASAYQKMGQLASARSYAQKAAAIRKGWGDPYILIGSLYAQSADGNCGSDEFEIRAVYWAAIDKFNYAAAIDEEVRAKANKFAAAYKAQVPSRELIFGKSMQGKTYTVGCWINETVKVPNL